MQNVVPARALARRSRSLIFAAVVIFVLGIFVAVLGVVLLQIPLVVPSNSNFTLYDSARRGLIGLGVVLGVLAVLMALRGITWKTDNQLAASTGEALTDFLDERYIFIRNISKRALGYVDAILIGPPGLLVFRITAKEGTFFNEGPHWLRQKDKGDWVTMRWSPTRETVDDIRKVREYLDARGLPDIPVFGVVVLTKDAPLAQVSQQNPIVPALHPNELSYDLSDTYFAKDRIDQATVVRIAEMLFA